jgi:hypothetical protein
MPILKTKSDLITSIQTDLADNNAGLISAEDLRSNMEDLAYSINGIVGSGDHNADFPFVNNVRASKATGNGFFIAESGLEFPNSPGAVYQYEAYPGAGGIDHNLLTNRHSSNSAHNQYLAIDGTRPMEENLPMANHWINSSGASFDNRGLKFENVGTYDNIHVGVSGSFVFSDNSKINNGRSVAKAWLVFDGSGTATTGVPVVKSHHNIYSLQRLSAGKYSITIPSGVLKDANFLAIGHSNARTSVSSQEDFDINTVGITQRSFNAGNGRATLTYLVLNQAGNYVDAELNDLVVFGYDKNETAQTAPIIV